MQQQPVIVTCALNGDTIPPDHYPTALEFPVTPKQIAAAAKEAAEAGAAVVHIHARDPETGGRSVDPAVYFEIVDRIRQSNVDVIINLTCGHGGLFFPDPDNFGGMTPDSSVFGVAERIAHVSQCRPEICSLDVTTGNQVDAGRDFIYYNPAHALREMAGSFREFGVKPELEIFGPGDVEFARQLIAEGLIEGTPLFQFVLGVKWAAPATPETMIYLKSLLPSDAVWTAFGISRMQMPLAAQAMLLGGNVRVGLEDNLYVRRGSFATNAELVRRAVTLADLLGRSVATPSEARGILGLCGPANGQQTSSQ